MYIEQKALLAATIVFIALILIFIAGVLTIKIRKNPRGKFSEKSPQTIGTLRVIIDSSDNTIYPILELNSSDMQWVKKSIVTLDVKIEQN